MIGFAEALVLLALLFVVVLVGAIILVVRSRRKSEA